MVKVKESTRKYLGGRWEIIVGNEFHGHCNSKVEAQRAAVDKINSIIEELKYDRKRLTDEILAAT